jgi:putative transposase
LDARKIASTNMLERLNKEIRRRTRGIGIFLNQESYVRPVMTYLIEYVEDWSVSRAYFNEQSLQGLLNKAA